MKAHYYFFEIVKDEVRTLRELAIEQKFFAFL